MENKMERRRFSFKKQSDFKTSQIDRIATT